MLLYTFYGDDFTGSTDVLETLAEAGIPAVLFLKPPTADALAQFPGVQAIGIAGDSRSRSPDWMTEHLPGIFRVLQSFGAPIIHYKTCSTFDSAPHIGSIGRALELGLETVHPRFVPIIVPAPHLGRSVLFGNLYASAGDEVYRIDLHPTMSRHPVTPMREPDLRKHLMAQTGLNIALLDVRHLTVPALEATLKGQPAAVLFDGYDDASLETVGELLWKESQSRRCFAVGSSGLTRSLIPAWRAQNLIASPSSLKSLSRTSQQNQILVLSGSCSPVTQHQIEHALANDFQGIPLDAADIVARPESHALLLTRTLSALAAGHSPLLYTALGPLRSGVRPHSEALGQALGILLKQIIERSGIRRTVLCGGDTSSHAIQQLPLSALTWLAPLTPGAPLCQAHSSDPVFRDTEFVLKGGQVGPHDFSKQ